MTEPLIANIPTTFTVKADIVGSVDGHTVQFRLDPNSVVMQTSGAVATGFVAPDHDVIIDGTPPSPPAITAFPAWVNYDTKAAVTVSGTAEPNATVTVTIQDMGAAHTITPTTMPTADGAGAWSATMDVSTLNDGPIAVSAYATDGAGNASTSSPQSTATKDTVAPVAPGAVSFPTVNSANQSGVTISGAAEAGATLNWVFTSSGGDTTGVLQIVAAGGSYNFTRAMSWLPDGTITATVTDAAGNLSPATTAAAIKDTVVNAPMATLQDANASNVGSRTLTGAAEPGATVDASISSSGGAGTLTGAATADGAGAYSITFDLTGLPDGTLTASVTQTDPAGNTSAAATTTAMKDTVAPAAPTIDTFSTVTDATRRPQRWVASCPQVRRWQS